jgi:hypothetical protein
MRLVPVIFLAGRVVPATRRALIIGDKSAGKFRAYHLPVEFTIAPLAVKAGSPSMSMLTCIASIDLAYHCSSAGFELCIAAIPVPCKPGDRDGSAPEYRCTQLPRRIDRQAARVSAGRSRARQR